MTHHASLFVMKKIFVFLFILFTISFYLSNNLYAQNDHIKDEKLRKLFETDYGFSLNLPKYVIYKNNQTRHEDSDSDYVPIRTIEREIQFIIQDKRINKDNKLKELLEKKNWNAYFSNYLALNQSTLKDIRNKRGKVAPELIARVAIEFGKPLITQLFITIPVIEIWSFNGQLSYVAFPKKIYLGLSYHEKNNPPSLNNTYLFDYNSDNPPSTYNINSPKFHLGGNIQDLEKRNEILTKGIVFNNSLDQEIGGVRLEEILDNGLLIINLWESSKDLFKFIKGENEETVVDRINLFMKNHLTTSTLLDELETFKTKIHHFIHASYKLDSVNKINVVPVDESLFTTPIQVEKELLNSRSGIHLLGFMLERPQTFLFDKITDLNYLLMLSDKKIKHLLKQAFLSKRFPQLKSLDISQIDRDVLVSIGSCPNMIFEELIGYNLNLNEEYIKELITLVKNGQFDNLKKINLYSISFSSPQGNYLFIEFMTLLISRCSLQLREFVLIFNDSKNIFREDEEILLNGITNFLESMGKNFFSKLTKLDLRLSRKHLRPLSYIQFIEKLAIENKIPQLEKLYLNHLSDKKEQQLLAYLFLSKKLPVTLKVLEVRIYDKLEIDLNSFIPMNYYQNLTVTVPSRFEQKNYLRKVQNQNVDKSPFKNTFYNARNFLLGNISLELNKLNPDLAERLKKNLPPLPNFSDDELNLISAFDPYFSSSELITPLFPSENDQRALSDLSERYKNIEVNKKNKVAFWSTWKGPIHLPLLEKLIYLKYLNFLNLKKADSNSFHLLCEKFSFFPYVKNKFKETNNICNIYTISEQAFLGAFTIFGDNSLITKLIDIQRKCPNLKNPKDSRYSSFDRSDSFDDYMDFFHPIRHVFEEFLKVKKDLKLEKFQQYFEDSSKTEQLLYLNLLINQWNKYNPTMDLNFKKDMDVALEKNDIKSFDQLSMKIQEYLKRYVQDKGEALNDWDHILFEKFLELITI